MRLWWTWTRRSHAWYFLPVIAGTLVMYRLVDTDLPIFTEWRWTSVEAGGYLFFGGAVIAGACAFESWLTHKRLAAFGAGLPVRRRLMFPVWVGTVTWWLLAHLVILAGHLLVAAFSGAVGTVSLRAIVLQLAAVAGWASLGVLTGWAVPHVATAPTLAVVLLAANFSSELVSDGFRIRELASFGSVRSLIGLDLAPAVLGWHILFFAGLVVAAVAIWRTALVRRLTLVLGLVASLVGLSMTATFRGAELTELSSASLECGQTPGGRTVCLVPAWRDHRTMAATSIDEVAGATRELGLEPPERFEVRSPSGVAVPPDGVGLVLPNGDLGALSTWKAAAVEGVAVPTWCREIIDAEPGDGERAWAMTATVADWLEHRVNVGRNDPGMADMSEPLQGLDENAQLAWVQEVYPKLWSCQIADLPAPEGLEEYFANGGIR